MGTNLHTVQGHLECVKYFAGRGRIQDSSMMEITFRVPFWRINVVKREVNLRRSIGVKCVVRSLSILDHFLLWEVIVDRPYWEA